jgi:DNA-binding winged helix-turn-helix (wHTH) protein
MPQSYQPITSEKKTFAKCQLDPAFQTLSTPHKVTRLRGKLYFVISCLVENQNRLVTRKQLIDECWGGNTFTGEKAVTHAICQLRKILKELDVPVRITTLSKQGYVFSQIDFSNYKELSSGRSPSISS